MGRRCHYEVLDIERDATVKTIKKAFHLQALKFHPDKHQRNNITPEEATERFQEIQNAYEVLSDPHERKWYDDHREQILRDDDNEENDSENDLNLFKYFSATVYCGFKDDDINGFYTVYSEVFITIDRLDQQNTIQILSSAPVFGNSKSNIEDVNRFYQHWRNYVTQRTFAWVDEYKTTDAPTRPIRRAMEKENKKLRDAAKKSFVAEVRELVEFVRKRDPRIKVYLAQKEQEKLKQQREIEQAKAEKQAAYEAERELYQQIEIDRWATHSTSRVADDHIQEELEKLRKKLDADVLVCDVCNKTFKSPKQLDNHLLSKKHKEREVELGIDMGSLEHVMEQDLLAEVEAMKQAQMTTMTDGIENCNVSESDEDANVIRQEQELVAQLKQQEKEEKTRIRLEKEQKAALLRQKRKEERKDKKKKENDVAAKVDTKKKGVVVDDFDSDNDLRARGRGKKEKKSKKIEAWEKAKDSHREQL